MLLIFDEVISGFRVGFEGAAGLYAIEPDLITYGKIIGGGMPVGAYGGKAEIMSHIAPDGPVYQAGTLSANPVTMAAGIATLKQLLEPGFYEKLDQKTQALCEKVNEHINSREYNAKMIHIGSIFWVQFTQERIFRSDQIPSEGDQSFRKIHKQLLDKGIYLGPSGFEVGFVSLAHTQDDLDFFANNLCEALDQLYDS